MNSKEGMGGIYREPTDPNTQALENMRRKIEAEGKHALLFSEEEVDFGREMPKFTELLKRKIHPKHIAFYSSRFGIMKYDEETAYPKPWNGHYSYDYRGKEGGQVSVSTRKDQDVIWIEKKLIKEIEKMNQTLKNK